MSMHPEDRLSAEEQALATRLRGLGRPEGPPDSLDVRILAAARQAAGVRTPSQHRRWHAWLAVPGSAVTVAGTAAAFVLVAGLVWQLRPLDRPETPGMQRSGDDSFVLVEPIGASSSADTRASATVQPTANQGDGVVAGGGQPRRVVPGAGYATWDGQPAATIARPQATLPPPIVAQEGAVAARADSLVQGVEEPLPAPNAIQGDAGSRPGAATPAAPPVRRPTYTTSARARAEVRSNPDRGPASGSGTHAVDRDGTARARDPGPVTSDQQLAPAEWLERIRLRLDRGDTEGAAESLRRFRKAYPRIRIPADLRELPR